MRKRAWLLGGSGGIPPLFLGKTLNLDPLRRSNLGQMFQTTHNNNHTQFQDFWGGGLGGGGGGGEFQAPTPLYETLTTICNTSHHLLHVISSLVEACK